MLFGELGVVTRSTRLYCNSNLLCLARKGCNPILISAAANLYMFNSRKFAEMTSRDEMFLPRMGLEQRALFIVLPDNDTTFNFIATMLYTQLFDQLPAGRFNARNITAHCRFMFA